MSPPNGNYLSSNPIMPTLSHSILKLIWYSSIPLKRVDIFWEGSHLGLFSVNTYYLIAHLKSYCWPRLHTWRERGPDLGRIEHQEGGKGTDGGKAGHQR